VIFPVEAPWWFFLAAIAIVAVQTAVWYSLVALVLSTPAARKSYARFARAVDVVAGSVMTAFGLRLTEELRAEIAARTPL
jgi:threonine efflux protein